jgi:NitT/TauT family transport system ATP-binding protein
MSQDRPLFEKPKSVSSTPNIIQMSDVYQSYDDDQVVIIDGFNLTIQKDKSQGRLIGLMGMSGCGKSTVLRYIAGLQKPTKGRVLLRGKPVNRENRATMVFQQYSSLPWMTVLDNVALAMKFRGITKSEREDKARDILSLVGLQGQENKFAQYPNLSGGQLQRVAIARSLMANPDVLLMDEPFGALDIKTRLQMQDLLLNIWRKFKSTIIFVTHDISEAVYLAQEIHIMKSAPSKIVRKIPIDLELERSRQTKRNPHFVELVHQVEDAMIEVAEM